MNDKARITNDCATTAIPFGSSSFGFPSSFVIRISSFARVIRLPRRSLAKAGASSFRFSLMHDELVALEIAKLRHPTDRRLELVQIKFDAALF